MGRFYYKTRQSLVPCSRALTSAHSRGLLLPGDFCPFSRHQGTLTIFDGVGDFAHERSRCSSQGTLLTAHPRGLCSRALTVLIPGDFAHGRSRCSSQGTLLTGAHFRIIYQAIKATCIWVIKILWFQCRCYFWLIAFFLVQQF